jgi:hypothetical protein
VKSGGPTGDHVIEVPDEEPGDWRQDASLRGYSGMGEYWAEVAPSPTLPSSPSWAS